jgi:hypothetical protein
MGKKKAKTVPLGGGWYQWEGERPKERVNVVETEVLMYENEKMGPVETIP